MFTELVMLSYDLILWCSLLLLPSVFPSIRVFSFELTLCIRWPKYRNLLFSPSDEYSGLVSFRIDWFNLLAVQGVLKSLLQHHSSKASIPQCSAFFTVQLSHPYPISWSFPGNLYFLLWWYCSVQWVSCVLVEKLNRVLLCKHQIKTRLSWV